MPIIQFKAFIVPGVTSAIICAPGYEKPLLQIKHNTNGDRSLHVREIDWPAALPATGKAKELSLEAEAMRLAAAYGVKNFRTCYPIDEVFAKAFSACEIAALPAVEQAVPDMDRRPPELIEEFMELRVPGMNKERATKLVESGFTADTLAEADIRSVTAVTGLPNNLIRSTIEAAKARPAEPRGAPSAPSEMRPKVEAPGLT